MAKGASAGFWKEEQLPALLKHEILGQYLPKFVSKLASTNKRIVLLDGYAGKGRYSTGAPGSAVQILNIARTLVLKLRTQIDVYLIEQNVKTLKFLATEVANFADVPGLRVFIIKGDVNNHIYEVVSAAKGVPLFLFLDPCGLGLPFSTLSHVLANLRPASGPDFAPTEVLLNFSAEAVRRIGGHVTSPASGPAALARMDETVGGEWWRAFYDGSYEKEKAESQVVEGYLQRLGSLTRMAMFAVPARRELNHRPLYFLVFGTRHRQGAWFFGHAVAHGTKAWRKANEERSTADQFVLEGQGFTAEEQQQKLEDDACIAIAQNLQKILNSRGNFIVGNYTVEVFGDYFGVVPEKIVRKAIKLLYDQGLISSTGVGRDIDRLKVNLPVR